MKSLIFKSTAVFVIILGFLLGCAKIQKVTQTLINLRNLEFKLESINNFRLNNINLSNKKSVSDFSLTDGVNLVQLFNSKKFPAEFTLNVAAKNPNDGTKGTERTSSTIRSLDWRLFIDDKLTVAGDIDKPIDIPGTGQSTIIPITIKLDLFEFFGQSGYSDVINLALALGGVNGSTSRVKLDIKPTVTTPLGAMTYPGRITVIDKEFRGN
ncbi:hypothetical protein D9V86_10310 [Bacteroidetes/Chlorobi group bacterium ChocPot_Mid]|nr:MAG: hypothetical protein D9V86_10310 [Bacteroidetes/Chlorobi group bacterium ChocPot_Mid]